MIAYVTVGADDIAGAKRFYSAFPPALDYRLEEASAGLSYAAGTTGSVSGFTGFLRQTNLRWTSGLGWERRYVRV